MDERFFAEKLHGKDFVSFGEMVSPAMAAQLLEYRYDRQRRLRKDRVKEIAGVMKRGSWMPGTEVRFAITPDGKIHMVNGQHTLSAIVECGISAKITIVIVSAQNNDDVAAIYSACDRHLKRTTGDSLSAYDVEGKYSLTPYQVSLMNAGIRTLYAANSERKNIETFLSYAENAIPTMDLWMGEMRYYISIKPESGDTRNPMRVSPVVAAVLVTRKYAPDAANNFWLQVRDDDGLAKGDPRKALRYFMVSAVLNGGGNTHGLSKHAYLATISYAWNKYMKGVSVGKISSQSPLDGISFSGTPYNSTLDDLGIGFPPGYIVSDGA